MKLVERKCVGIFLEGKLVQKIVLTNVWKTLSVALP